MENNTWTEQVLVTPEMARMMLDDWQYDRQRRIQWSYVSSYAQQMKEGLWRDTPPITCTVLGRCHHLINGQHRLLAIEKAGIPVLVTVLYKKVYSVNDVAQDYVVEDNGKSRNDGDRQRAFFGSEMKYATSRSASARMILGNFKATTKLDISPQGLLDTIQEWSTELDAYFDIAKKASASGGIGFDKMKRSCVASVASVVLRYVPDKAQTFWTTVAENDGLRKGMPEYALVKLILTSEPRKLIGREAEYSRKVAHCWNAFYSGESLIYPQCRDYLRPIVIKGTPYKG